MNKYKLNYLIMSTMFIFTVAVGTENKPPVETAIDKGQLEVVKILRDAGAKIDVEYGRLIKTALAKVHFAVVKILREAGVKVDAENETLIKMVSANFEIAKAIKELGPTSETLIMKAVDKGYFEAEKTLREAGAKGDVAGDILSKISGEYFELVQSLLMEVGIEVDAENNTALMMMALAQGHLEVVKVLRDVVVKVKAESTTSRKIAVDKNSLEVDKALSDAGVKVDDTEIETLPIKMATVYLMAMDILGKAGITADTKNDGLLIKVALAKGHLDVLKALIKAGVKIDEKSDTLVKIVQDKGSEVVKAIREVGIKVDVAGDTVIKMALSILHFNVVETLRDTGVKADVENDTLIKIAVAHLELMKAVSDASANVNKCNAMFKD